MKAKYPTSWNGADDFGFSALPGGGRFAGGSFSDVGLYGNWWAATEDNAGNPRLRNMVYDFKGVGSGSDDVSNGFSVRCVQGVSIAPAEPQQPKAEGLDLAKILKTEIPFIGAIMDGFYPVLSMMGKSTPAPRITVQSAGGHILTDSLIPLKTNENKRKGSTRNSGLIGGNKIRITMETAATEG